MSKQVEGLGKGAAAGAGLGASLGSIVGPWGTAIGGAAGAIGGGLYGYFSAETPEEEEAQRQAAIDAQNQSSQRAKEDAWEQFMLASAPKASAALKNRARLERAYENIDRGAQNDIAMFEAQRAAADQRGMTEGITGLARAGSTIGNRFYNAAKTPSVPDASSFAPMPSAQVRAQPADLSNIPAPVYTPSSIQDPSLSPEQQDIWDAENLKPLRRGVRVGF